ncbi:chemotaxis protein CheB [Nocardia sp. IFM 10818]
MTEPSDVIVVGASAGGVEALQKFVHGLPADLPAAVLVVLHLPVTAVSTLATILDRAGVLPAHTARQGMPLEAGAVYTATPRHHLLVSRRRIVLSHGPTENGHRPGVNALFRSAALTWAPRVAGVVLSGSLDDGTAGLALIKSRGGVAAVQDPADAKYRSMPETALRRVQVDLVRPARELGPALAETLRVRGDLPAPLPPPDLTRLEAQIDAGAAVAKSGMATLAPPADLICPDCDGPLLDMGDGLHFRCLVGHAWTAAALLIEENTEIERALWMALRALEDKRRITRRMQDDARRQGQDDTADRFAARSAEHDRSIDVLRRLLVLRDGN